MKIDLDCAPRKVASSPELNNRAFAVITNFHIHAILDVQIFAGLSRDQHGQSR
jgi:hypothetical protein